MNQIDIQYYKTKIGELILGSFDNKLCLLDFRYRRMRSTVDNRIKKELNAEYLEQENNVLKETRKQIDEYLIGKRTEFEVPILMVGSNFQKQVWKALINVKYGEIASYLDLAKNIENAKAVRAVASANGANSIGLIIPCHRIIGSNGELVGYGGGLPVKKRLLNLEKENSKLTDDEKYEFIRNRIEKMWFFMIQRKKQLKIIIGLVKFVSLDNLKFEEKLLVVTTYKNYSRNSCKFNDCSPFQLHRKLKDLSFAVGYYSYTNQ